MLFSSLKDCCEAGFQGGSGWGTFSVQTGTFFLAPFRCKRNSFCRCLNCPEAINFFLGGVTFFVTPNSTALCVSPACAYVLVLACGPLTQVPDIFLCAEIPPTNSRPMPTMADHGRPWPTTGLDRPTTVGACLCPSTTNLRQLTMGLVLAWSLICMYILGQSKSKAA